MNTMTYKGYLGSVAYSEKEAHLHNPVFAPYHI